MNRKNLYLYSILLFALTLPLSRAAISFFIILFLISFYFQKDIKTKLMEVLKFNPIKLLLIFLSFEFLMIFPSNNITHGIEFYTNYLYLFAILPLVYYIKKEWINYIIDFFLFGMFISEIIAYGVYFHIWSFSHATPEYLSPFMMHIDYSVFLALSSIILLNKLFLQQYTIKNKIFIFIFFLSVTTNLFMSIGRTGQLAFVISIIILSLHHFSLSYKTLLASFLLIFSIVFIAHQTNKIFQERVYSAKKDIKNITNGNFNTSLGIRVLYWKISFEVLKEHPIFGVGLGDYKIATKEQMEKNNYNLSTETINFMENMHFHNQYLMILVQSGLSGLFLFLIFLYSIFKLEIIDKELNIIKNLFLTIFIVSFMAEPLLAKQFTRTLFILFLSLVLVASRRKTQN